ncbi:peptidoglycan-binding protein [Alteromonas gracilis]|uniref:peptidoglycan-binding protein n=1 Tax=Alteromonas gracilis TaxID=1479524 RepID=UPI00373615D1
MLKLYDGFATGRPDCKAEVMHLQRCFNGLSIPMAVDGFFGVGTETAVSTFQKEQNLPVTSIVDNATWMRIEQLLESGVHDDTSKSIYHVTNESQKAQTEYGEPSLGAQWSLFRGDLTWLHDREGHAGKAYWPGGASGVTLDPGFDLGQQEPEELNKHYASMLNPIQLVACKRCLGLKGRDAKAFLNQSLELLSIRITKGQALKVMPYIAVPYWVAVAKRFPNVKGESCPGTVHTALLSLAFNRGPNNSALSCLSAPIEQHNWSALATEIGNMQQNHSLAGIRKRRRMEADLIANTSYTAETSLT